MTSTPDARLVEAHDLARAALAEITPPETIGEPVEYAVEDDGVVSLRFANRMRGYPGWFWTVSVAATADTEPTVLETELLPGDGALVAPDWVPWATRLADYHAAQAALAALAVDEDLDDLEEDVLDEDDSDLDEDDSDTDGEDADDLDADDLDDDFDPDASPRLHAGDLDGVDIDELDPDDSAEGDPDDGDDGDSDEDESGDVTDADDDFGDADTDDVNTDESDDDTASGDELDPDSDRDQPGA